MRHDFHVSSRKPAAIDDGCVVQSVRDEYGTGPTEGLGETEVRGVAGGEQQGGLEPNPGRELGLKSKVANVRSMDQAGGASTARCARLNECFT